MSSALPIQMLRCLSRRSNARVLLTVLTSRRAAHADALSSFVDDLCSGQPVKADFPIAYQQKLVQVRDEPALQKVLDVSRPKNAAETLLFVQKLRSLGFLHVIDVREYLERDDVVSMLTAHLLTPGVDPDALLHAGVALLPEMPTPVEGVDTQSPLLTFYAQFITALSKAVNPENHANISADAAVNFFGVVQEKRLAGLFPGEDLNKLVMLKIPEITTSGLALSVIRAMKPEHFAQVDFTMQVFAKVEELAPVMLMGELVTLMSILCQNKCKRYDILQLLCEKIRLHTDIMTPTQLTRLALAIADSIVFYPRLVSRFCTDFVNSTDQFRDWASMLTVINFFAKGKIANDVVWESVVAWMDAHVQKAQIGDLRFALSACAVANVDPEAIKFFVNHVRGRLHPSQKEVPRNWLNTMWSLAVLDGLSPKLAESILQGVFVDEICKTARNPVEKAFLVQKILQVASSVAWDLKEPGLAKQAEKFNFDVPKEAWIKLMYGKQADQYKSFLQNLSICVPADCRKEPAFMPEIGAFVPAIVSVSPDGKKFSALNSPEKRLVAVVYLTHNHFLHTFTGDDEIDYRLRGDIQMTVRHLEKSGYVVCEIPERDLQTCQTTVDRIKLIKERLQECGREG